MIGRGTPSRIEAASFASTATSTSARRSAPEYPSVRAAIRSRSIPSWSRPSRWIRTISAPGARSGGGDEDDAVEAPGPAERGVEVPGRVGRRQDQHALVVRRTPSSSARNWLIR